mmetsp:Transcript_15190/g.34896  ORF Transcript_15190/g.34896 Transcript_15190/m.34896 type:complete len:226 (-) Transcript_15190:180-857(-)|eukprot:CAMPEP_0119376724 /NCGR_PEP_ID=MMETSP1334-20130426/40992_1 /TAXON_ID=127549 /ORGANISM="Calcidiscus leptoporus, Strain RCC1130" /LENGTH=225 /DNA_ID=CAMNT_0007395377 /DNA_START=91 /DNA_END=768 /DNA_ORIENTATION=+
MTRSLLLLFAPVVLALLKLPVEPGMQLSRRSLGAALAVLPVGEAIGRTPGSSDVGEAVEQIKQARHALRQLQRDWSTFACIDREGRACNIDTARKILGGVAPQRGDAAIEVAKVTPLYRIDGAFKAVRRYAIDASDTDWGSALDLEAFVEKGEDIVFALKKTDDSFYSVVFASKGTIQLENIYKEAKQSVDTCLADFDAVTQMLADARPQGFDALPPLSACFIHS